jgi:hypothetical protein
VLVLQIFAKAKCSLGTTIELKPTVRVTIIL